MSERHCATEAGAPGEVLSGVAPGRVGSRRIGSRAAGVDWRACTGIRNRHRAAGVRPGGETDTVIKLNKSTLYALYAVVELSQETERRLSAAEIAQRHGASEHHVAKVLQQLARAGLVRSSRGLGGGFRLDRDPKDVTLLDVVQVFEPYRPLSAQHTVGDLPSASPPSDSARRVAEVLNELDEQAYYTLKSIRVATLMAPKLLT